MTQEQNSQADAQTPTSEQIAEYLRVNPEFFEQNLDVLAQMQIPHLSGKGTTSLIERQVQVLREQAQTYQDQLKTFTLFASENEELWIKFKDLAVMLLFHSGDDLTPELIAQWLKDQYALSAVVIHQATQVELNQAFGKQSVMQAVLNEREIHCSAELPQSLLNSLFDQQAQEVKSCALIPLVDKNHKLKGIMVLGSENNQRFTDQQSTAYLSCLSQVITQALETV